MAHRTASAALCAALVALGGGCGTLINQSNEPGHAFYSDQFPPQMPYGGVLRDLAAPPAGIYQAATQADTPPLGRAQMAAAAVLIPPFDLPFSLLADTLFLPFDLAHTVGLDGGSSSTATGGQPPTAPMPPTAPTQPPPTTGKP